MIKDEAAASHAEEMVCERQLAYPPATIERTIVKDFKSGWTQHGDELIKMAREKVFDNSPEEYPDEFVIKLSDLESILEALK